MPLPFIALSTSGDSVPIEPVNAPFGGSVTVERDEPWSNGIFGCFSMEVQQLPKSNQSAGVLAWRGVATLQTRPFCPTPYLLTLFPRLSLSCEQDCGINCCISECCCPICMYSSALRHASDAGNETL